MNDPGDSQKRLIALLQLAHSGELAAALAYRGHWRSLRDAGERERVREIEKEELHHRELLAEMLLALGVEPHRFRERRARVIGRTLGAACHVAGWLAPMYGAGKLESRNIREYELAARYAWGCGRDQWLDCLLAMAEVEWEHERYFRERVLAHWLGRRLPIWPKPAPKASIRERFVAETGKPIPPRATVEPRLAVSAPPRPASPGPVSLRPAVSESSVARNRPEHTGV